MRLPFLSPKDSKTAKRSAATPDDLESVDAARTRARRRLVGALVLMVVGVITFPLLFETQPRPIAVNTPIEIAQRAPQSAVGVVKPVPAPSPEAGTGRSAPPVLPASVTPTTTPESVAGMAAEARAPAAPASVPAAAAMPARPAAKLAAAAAAPRADDSARATVQVAAEPAPASEDKAGGRFIVQAGAYSEPTALREARAKLEKMGLKTYTQVIDSDAGKRTRVRVGPFATRQEAEAVAGKVKAAGLPANVLVL